MEQLTKNLLVIFSKFNNFVDFFEWILIKRNIESYTKELTTSKENPDFNWAESQNELIKQNEEKDYPSLMRVGISESCPIPRPEEGKKF